MTTIEDYPYKQISFKSIQKRINNIRNYTWKLEPSPDGYDIFNIPDLSYFDKCYYFQGCPTLIVNGVNDYLDYNNVSDFYNEVARMKTRRYDSNMSPYDYYFSVKDTLITNDPLTTIVEPREYLNHAFLEASNFRPTLLAGAIEEFKATSVLDISAGWGDRLIAACAKDVEYVGVDPNPDTQIGYLKIIRDFGESKYINDRCCTSDKQQVIFAPFEDAILPKRNYDLIFTSPPYFDLEIYSENEDQSVSRYKTADAWFNNFLMFSLRKAWDNLIVGGHMAININDIKNKNKYVQRMVAEVNKWSDSFYLGLLSYVHKVNKRSPQPIWIWKKIKPFVLMYEPYINVYDNIDDGNLFAGSAERLGTIIEKAVIKYTRVKSRGLSFYFDSNDQIMIMVSIILKGNVTIVTKLTDGIVTDPVLKSITFGARIIDDIDNTYSRDNNVYIINPLEIYSNIVKESKDFKESKDSKESIFVNDKNIADSLKKLGYLAKFSNDNNKITIQAISNIYDL